MAKKKSKASEAARALGRLGGLEGGKARAKSLTSEERSEIARRGAAARWGGDNLVRDKSRPIRGAHAAILDRGHARSNVEQIVEHSTPACIELIDYCTHLIYRLGATESNGSLVSVAPLAMLHHAITMLDGMDLLMQKSCVIASVPLIRGIYEAWFQLTWMSHDPAQSSRRSFAWLVAELHRERLGYERLDPTTDRGRQFAARVRKDKYAGNATLPPVEAVQAAISNSDEMLKNPELAEASEELARLMAAGNNKPYWFTYFDGPRAFDQIWAKLNIDASLLVQYDDLSDVSHGRGIDRFLVRAPGGVLAFGNVRYPHEMSDRAKMATLLTWDISRMVVEMLSPDDLAGHAEWYIRHLRPKLLRLGAIQVRRPDGSLLSDITARMQALRDSASGTTY